MILLQFPENRYAPTVEATAYELQLAKDEYDTAHTAAFDVDGDEELDLRHLDRFRAARNRLWRAQDLAREARFMIIGQKVGAIWS